MFLMVSNFRLWAKELQLKSSSMEKNKWFRYILGLRYLHKIEKKKKRSNLLKQGLRKGRGGRREGTKKKQIMKKDGRKKSTKCSSA